MASGIVRVPPCDLDDRVPEADGGWCPGQRAAASAWGVFAQPSVSRHSDISRPSCWLESRTNPGARDVGGGSTVTGAILTKIGRAPARQTMRIQRQSIHRAVSGRLAASHMY
jgi:hypothetical protein